MGNKYRFTSSGCGLLGSSLESILVLPNAAGVVLGAGDDGVSFVVEGTGEDFVFVALQHLQLVPCIH